MPLHDAPVPLDELLVHRAWVRQMARALVSRDADADDLAQDAWAQALTHPPTKNSSLRGWFAVLLRHRMLNRRRADSRRTAREATAARSEVVPGTQADVVAMAETHKRIVDAVVALDEPYRTTILLRYFEELSPRAVAERLGVPVTTVRSRGQRALGMLREELIPHDGPRRAHLLAFAGGEDSRHSTPGRCTLGTRTPQTVVAMLGGVLVGNKLTAVVMVALLALGIGAVVTAIGRSAPHDPVPQASFSVETHAPPDAEGNAARQRLALGSRRHKAAPNDVHSTTDVGALKMFFRGRDGRAVSDAIATLTTRDGATRSISSRDAGSVMFVAIPVGPVDVVVRAPGCATARHRSEIAPGCAVTHMTLGDGGETDVLVLAEDGSPIDGARVWVLMGGRLERRAFLMQSGVVDEARTDAYGHARLAGIATSQPATIFADAPGRRRASLVIQTVKGEPLERTLRMAPGGSLTGVVRDADGAPLAAARVFALPPDARGHTKTSATDLASGYGRSLLLTKGFSSLTNAAGAFRIEGLAFGVTYLVVGAADGRAASAPVEVRVSDATPSVTATIHVVVLSSLRVRVVNGSGERVKDAVVRLIRPRQTEPLSPIDDGEFVASALARGDARVAISASGFARQELTANLRPGEETMIEARLVPGRTVRGVVINDGGEPVGPLSIAATPASFPHRRVIAKADVRGRFAFDDLGPGEHELVVLSHGSFVTREPVVVAPGVTEVSVVVVRSATAKLRVRGLSANAPTREVRYEIRSEHRDSERGGSTWTRRGELNLSGLTPGRHEILVYVAGFAPAAIVLNLKSGEAHASEIVLDTGRSEEGRIIATDGSPVSGARVTLSAEPSLANQVATTDTDGRFVLHHLGTTGAEVHVAAEGFLNRNARLAPRGTAPECEIEMSRGALICGVARSVDGVPLEGEPVWAVDPATGRRVARADTDADGHFRLRVRAGRWRVELLDSPGSAIETSASEPAASDIELRRDH